MVKGEGCLRIDVRYHCRRQVSLQTSGITADVRYHCRRQVSLQTSGITADVRYHCRRQVSLQTSGITADVSLHCRRQVSLQTSAFTADVSLHCRRQPSLQTSAFTADVSLHCRRQPLLQTSGITADVSLHCRRQPSLQTSAFTADVSLHCRRQVSLQTSGITADVRYHCRRQVSLQTSAFTADVRYHCRRQPSLQTSAFTADVSHHCRRQVSLQTSGITADVRYHCRRQPSLQTSAFTADVSHHCRRQVSLQTSAFAADVSLRCRRQPSLQTSAFAADVRYHCRRQPSLQTSAFAADASLHCRRQPSLQTSAITADVRYRCRRQPSLQTSGIAADVSHDSVKLIKFADDTTLIGLISNNDESAYRREVDRLVSWCSGNNLELNAQKTVEMIVDFRKSTVPPPPPSVMDSPITSVESFRFLGTTITQDLKWEPTISSLIKKAQQRMYFLRQLRKAKLPAQMLVQFYTAIIESILTSSITVWFAGATVRDKQRLQRIVRSAEEVIGRSLPSLQDLHDSVKLIKFADDTTLIGLISNNDESAYRREVDRLVSWCSGNNLELNAQKTVEMIVDFRKSTVPPPPPSVMDSPITSVESFRFLGTTITQDLKWEPTISSLIKKAQQRMYFLRQLRKAKLPAQMLVQFYTAIIESILTSSITVWFAGATVRDKQRLQRIVRSAEEVIGRSLPSLQDLETPRSGVDLQRCSGARIAYVFPVQ
uniref:Alkylated DNA repair protein AlkB homologue 8 N-terminal domain-containing protein n=1 Tax=Knipowitschia caucasica TaxID=637954 RepID=A0AAV2J9C7_KNICA